MTRSKNIVNEADVAWAEAARGARNASKRKRLGPEIGLERLGASLYELPPGKRAFPRHWHATNEELLYVLAGIGTLRLGDEAIPVRAGDFVALPAGPEHAHELVNGGDVPLRYLAVSTMVVPDVVHYPDSQKLMTVEGRGPDGRPRGGVYREGAAVDYWLDEE
jgi:uncharacterized cupin superfamily protein